MKEIIALSIFLYKSVNFSNHCCHCYDLESVVKPTIIIIIYYVLRDRATWQALLKVILKPKLTDNNSLNALVSL